MPKKSKPPNANSLIIRPSTGLISHPDGGSSAMSEMVNRSLVHIQTSKSLTVPVRRAGDEQEFAIAPGVKIVMCWIPPGEFLMGSPEDELGRGDDETQHWVTITQGFWLAKTQTTQAQWQAVMGSNPSSFKGPNLPVEQVYWDAIFGYGGFMEKVNCYSSEDEAIFSLPTEAQWEYACRAGTTSTLNSGKNLTDAFGKCPNLDEVAWYKENSKETTQPVGQKQANNWGLHDMHGNVCEWCADWYGDYTDEFLVDPQGPITGETRVVRGGDWINKVDCRAAARSSRIPSINFLIGMGFRLARSSVP